MLKPAFSTVACPDWTITQVAERAGELGFECVELRTFGDASRKFACDPALTSESKVRSLMRERGVEPICLASGVRFDEPIWPPVLGVFGAAAERSVREGKRAVDLAVGIECPLVRVFGYEYPARETRKAAMKRICDRLRMVIDHADKSGVCVVIENGGSFATSDDLNQVLDEIKSPLLGACYSPAVGMQAGEDFSDAVRKLGERLWVARIKDARDGKPVLLGEGDLHCHDFVQSLVLAGFDGPLVFEWDRAWIDDLAPAEEALRHASRTIWGWLGGKVEQAPAAVAKVGAKPSKSAAAGRR